jgi:hypothetical protein
MKRIYVTIGNCNASYLGKLAPSNRGIRAVCDFPGGYEIYLAMPLLRRRQTDKATIVPLARVAW